MDIDRLMEISPDVEVSKISTGNKNIILKEWHQSTYYGVNFYCPGIIKTDMIMQFIKQPSSFFFCVPEYFMVAIDLSYTLKKQLRQKNYDEMTNMMSSTGVLSQLILNDIIIENDLGIMIREKKIIHPDTDTYFFFLNRRRFNKKI